MLYVFDPFKGDESVVEDLIDVTVVQVHEGSLLTNNNIF